MSAVEDLLGAIFPAEKPAFYAEFAGWVRASRRFRQFANDYRGKIRTKLRNARGEDGLADVRAELATAFLLLHNERFALEYEAYAAAKQRGPDFTVIYRTHTRFNIEVRRLRPAEDEAAGRADETLTSAQVRKRVAVLLDKAGQMPPGIVNLLWLTGDALPTPDDLSHLTAAGDTLRALADAKADDFFARRGFAHAADFLRQYRHLSGVVLHGGQGAEGHFLLWHNPLARHKTPPEIARDIQRLRAV